MLRVLVLLSLFFIGTNCSRKEGCIEPNATNYSFDAEENCCCTYPNLVLQLDHRVDTFDINLDSNYLHPEGFTFAFHNVALYFSDFRITDADGNVSEVLDVFSDEGITTKDDIILVKRLSIRNTLGMYNNPNPSMQLEFNFGLPIEHMGWDTETQEDLSSSHPLSIQEDSLYIGENAGYYFGKINVTIDETNYEILLSDRSSIFVSTSIFPIIGTAVNIPLVLDYQVWLDGFDSNMSADARAELIAQNIATSFSPL